MSRTAWAWAVVVLTTVALAATFLVTPRFPVPVPESGPPATPFGWAGQLSLVAGDGMRVVAVSRLYRSPAWPDPSEPEYVNAVAAVETSLGPSDVLARLHTTERRFGRERGRMNAPRTLDLDLIDFGGVVDPVGPPVLPHPRLAARAFVVLPLAELAPGWRHPVTGRTVADLIAALPADHGCAPV